MRKGLKEAGVQVSEDSEAMSRWTETAYKAQSLGELAQHEVFGTTPRKGAFHRLG